MSWGTVGPRSGTAVDLGSSGSCSLSVLVVTPIVVSVVGGAAGGSPSAAAPGGGEWTTYGGNVRRTAEQPRSPDLRPLRPLWRTEAIDGAVDGEPLIYDGRV